MIDEDRTMQLYGYTSDELSAGSHKPIVGVCDDCGKYRLIENRRYVHLCKSCSMIGEKNHFYGKQHDATALHKMSISHMGHRQSDETKHKIAKASTGRHHTEESKRKMSLANFGAKHYNWKGGSSSWRKRIWNSASYKNWREYVFKRDDYTCQICNRRGSNLEVHHIQPVKGNKNTLSIFDINNGITLCKRCHNKTKRKEYEFVEQFEAIIRGKQT